MKTRDNLQFRASGAGDNKMRTALTTLGVIIGVAAVAGAIGIGQSAFGQVLDCGWASGSNPR